MPTRLEYEVPIVLHCQHEYTNTHTTEYLTHLTRCSAGAGATSTKSPRSQQLTHIHTVRAHTIQLIGCGCDVLCFLAGTFQPARNFFERRLLCVRHTRAHINTASSSLGSPAVRSKRQEACNTTHSSSDTVSSVG